MADILSKSHRFRTVPNEVLYLLPQLWQARILPNLSAPFWVGVGLWEKRRGGKEVLGLEEAEPGRRGMPYVF